MKKLGFILLAGLTVLNNESIRGQTSEFTWAKRAGGTLSDRGNAIATDSFGNSYVTGSFEGSTVFGSITLSSVGAIDVFVAKYDAAGNVIWAKRAGGSAFDFGVGIAIDGSGNSYVLGEFFGSATFGNITLTSIGNNDDIFVAKFDALGNVVWAKRAGGTSLEIVSDIATDDSGNSYITGGFSGSASFGAMSLSTDDNFDLFVVKYDAAGNVMWGKQAGGPFNDLGQSITTDDAGNSYVTGWFDESARFGATTLISAGIDDIFVVKYDATGNVMWAKRAGGNSSDEGNAIALDSSGNSYVAGIFEGSATFGTTTLISLGSTDLFVAKYDVSGNVIWAKRAGSALDDFVADLVTDAVGNAYITGGFEGSTNFDIITLVSAGNNDIFLAKYGIAGNIILAKRAGGTSRDTGSGIALDNAGNSYIIGGFNGAANFGTISLVSAGMDDIFIAKTLANLPPIVANQIPNQTLVVAGASFTRDLNISPVVFSDPDGDVLNYAASSSVISIATARISGSTLIVTPVSSGMTTITVTANDGKSGAASRTFNVTVNRPPVVANIIPNQTLTIGSASFVRNLNASPMVFTDPDGDVMTYTVNSSATNIATASFSSSTLTVSPVAAGNSTITVTANDGKGGTISTTFVVSVAIGNRPPLVANAIPNQILTVGGTSLMRDLNSSPIVFSDPDGNLLAYSASSSAITIATANVSGSTLMVSPIAVGSATITVTANDGRGGMISTTFTAMVNLPAYPSSLNLNTTVNYPSRSSASDYPATEYRIVGLPGASNRLVNEFLSGTQNKDWQVYRDNGGASNFFEIFNGSSNFQFSTGRAFWIISKRAFSANLAASSAPLNAVQEIEVPLQNGWNLITNPFTVSILWLKIQTANNVTEPIWAFNGSFSQADTFKTYAGYYFFNATNLALLKIPYSAYFSGGSAADVVSTDWRVHISLTADKFNEQAASFGVSSEASDELDAFDFRKPRALAATPTVEFKRPQWDAKYSIFATDIRPEFEDSESWAFDVRALSRQPAQLTFSGLSHIPGHFEVYLSDESRAQSINLREDSLYQFTPAAELIKFKVVVGRKEKVQEQLSAVALPKAFALRPNYPNPFLSEAKSRSAGNPMTTIPVEVPIASEIKLKIYNLLGAEVKTIYDGSIEAGRYWFNWDGRNELGSQVATGVYLYRLTTNTRVALMGKMILMR